MISSTERWPPVLRTARERQQIRSGVTEPQPVHVGEPHAVLRDVARTLQVDPAGEAHETSGRQPSGWVSRWPP